MCIFVTDGIKSKGYIRDYSVMTEEEPQAGVTAEDIKVRIHQGLGKNLT